MGQATICYQHNQAQLILEKLLKSDNLSSNQKNDIKEAIEWIDEANKSAQRMETKLRWYKETISRNKCEKYE